MKPVKEPVIDNIGNIAWSHFNNKLHHKVWEQCYNDIMLPVWGRLILNKEDVRLTYEDQYETH